MTMIREPREDERHLLPDMPFIRVATADELTREALEKWYKYWKKYEPISFSKKEPPFRFYYTDLKREQRTIFEGSGQFYYVYGNDLVNEILRRQLLEGG